MARVINSVFSPIIHLHSNIIKEDGSVIAKVFKVDDEVINLRYVENRSIKKISGRVAKITYERENKKLKRYYTTAAKARSWFSVDIKPAQMIIDDSLVRHSQLYPVSVREILEDELVTEVDRIENYLTYGFAGVIEMSDGSTNTFTVMEGQTLNNIMYMYKGDEAIIESAKLVAITYDNYLNPESLILNENGTIRSLLPLQIISIEGATDPVSSLSRLDVAVAGAKGELFVEAGTFNTPINITKDLVIKGNKFGVSGSKSTRDKKTFSNETILTGKITVSEGVNVVLDGLVLTGGAVLDIGKAASVELKNCIVSNITAPSSRDFIIRTGDDETQLTVDNCFFGAYNKSTGRIYNLFEMNCKLKDGSAFTNNYFQDGCSANNDICIYNVCENVTITIDSNIWENSANGIRVGVKGNPTCNVIISNNEYKGTLLDNDGEYAGLLLIQPYGKQTTGMSGVVIRLTNNTHKDKYHLYYLYAGKSDMPFKLNNLPTVYVNNQITDPLSVYNNNTGVEVDAPNVEEVTSVAAANEKLQAAVNSTEPVIISIKNNIDMTSGGSIVVPSDADVTVDIPSGVTVKAVSNAFDVKDGAKLTLSGDGKIVSTTKNTNPAVSVNGGEVVLDGVTIDCVTESGKADNCAYGIYASNAGIVTIKSGKIITALGACIGTNNTTGTGNINIMGGELLNDGAYALYFGGQTVTNITGGKVQGINARMGDFTIGGDAEIIPTTINDSNCDPIGSNINTSGCIWLGDTIAMVLGSYKQNAGDVNKADLKLVIKDNAKVTSNYRSGIGIYKLDTKQDYIANVSIESANAVNTTAEGFDAIEIYDHAYLSEKAIEAGKSYNPTVEGSVTVTVAGEVTKSSVPTVIDGDDPVDDDI